VRERERERERERKAFDSIWHEGLLYKLIECGVERKTYNIIKSMYTNNKCAVKIGKNRFLPTGPCGETGMQLKPHPLQITVYHKSEYTPHIFVNI
jgi:hypothetical protein